MTAPASWLDVDSLAEELDRTLRDSDQRLTQTYPGDPMTRQPVHTVYVPASQFQDGLVCAWSTAAIELLDRLAPDAERLAAITELPLALAGEVGPLVRAKLAREPIEDLRIDFEDGYGDHGDAAEDAEVDRAAATLLAQLGSGAAPPFHGIRFKSFEAPTRRRGVRTLARFVTHLAAAGPLPEGFVVTLPKVTAVEQVHAMVIACERIEDGCGLAPGSLRFEIQVETPQSILLAEGSAGVARMIAAAQQRCIGLHFGTYDYSASLGIAGAYQSMEHPAADHAKAVMQVAAAGTGVRLSDGSTNVVPVGSDDEVVAAWRLHTRLVDRSLRRGFYQGWDLHPAQLVTRYAATFGFYRRDFPGAAARLRAYVAHDDSGFLDEPATARALAWFVSRGLDSGALTGDECQQTAGLTPDAVARLAAGRTA